MFARVNQFQDDPAAIDESERYVESEIVPQLRSVPGFVGVLSLTDRGTGRSLGITFWETEEAMRVSEAEAGRMRGEIHDSTGSELQEVERYEVTLRVGL